MNSVNRSIVLVCTSVLLLMGWTEGARAQFTILTVSGSPTPFTVSTAVAGSEPTAISNALTTYFVKAKKPAGAQKITAQLDAPTPVGTTLSIQLAPSSGATSMGAVILDAVPRDIVVNIDKENGSSFPITYVFTASVSAGVVVSQTRTVTLTMLNYP